MKPEAGRSLLTPLLERSRATPDARLLVFVGEDGSRQTVTARELDGASAAYAAGFAALGLGSEDMVIFILEHSLDLIFAFWGALRAGILPAIFPAMTPKLDPAYYQDRVRRLAEQAEAWGVVTSTALEPSLASLFAGTDRRLLSIETLHHQADPASPQHNRQPGGDRLAFIQYSSGTTGLQKGVALSHTAILNNLEAIRLAVQAVPQDCIVTWLPLHHDMGLLTGVLLPVYLGIPAVILSPLQWVRDPGILLRAVHEFRGTLTWMPNFAFHHSIRGVRQRDTEGLDLSSWRRLFNASEPVRYHSLQMFLDRFAPLGLAEQALASGYGLAEITGAVTLSPVGRPPRVDWVRLREYQEERRAVPTDPETPGSIPLVSSGRLVLGAEVRIVDDAEQPLPDRHIGQILVRSNSTLSGYFRRPDLTSDALRLGWHRTGDLGYWSDGELFVTGRSKDLIISGGKNIYPEDLETVVDSVPGMRPGRSVAFGIADPTMGTEAIILIGEMSEPLGPDEIHQLTQAIRRRVTQTLDVALSDVRLVDRGWVVKTPAGKMARSANREKYQALLKMTAGDS